MAGPFHDDLRWDAGGKSEADEGATTGVVALKFLLFVFVKNCTCEGVEVDWETIICFLCGYLEQITINIGALDFRHVGVSQACECTEAEEVSRFFLFSFSIASTHLSRWTLNPEVLWTMT